MFPFSESDTVVHPHLLFLSTVKFYVRDNHHFLSQLPQPLTAYHLIINVSLEYNTMLKLAAKIFLHPRCTENIPVWCVWLHVPTLHCPLVPSLYFANSTRPASVALAAVFSSTTKGYLWWPQTQVLAVMSHSSLMALKMPKNQVNYMVHKMLNTAFHSQDTVQVFHTKHVFSESLFKYVFFNSSKAALYQIYPYT